MLEDKLSSAQRLKLECINQAIGAAALSRAAPKAETIIEVAKMFEAYVDGRHEETEKGEDGELHLPAHMRGRSQAFQNYAGGGPGKCGYQWGNLETQEFEKCTRGTGHEGDHISATGQHAVNNNSASCHFQMELMEDSMPITKFCWLRAGHEGDHEPYPGRPE